MTGRSVAGFEVIPVIDLMGGRAVRAHAGRRALYRPRRSPLCPSCEPAEMAQAMLAATGAGRLYVADLDAIAGGHAQDEGVTRLQAACPDAVLWLDAAVQDLDRCEKLIGRGLTPVIGSESLTDMSSAATVLDRRAAVVLSLDFDLGGFRGPEALQRNSAFWPDRIIVMSLAHVGAQEGPDIERLRDLVARAGERRVYAAGGVRSASDLRSIKVVGAAGALVASAVHSGAITQKEIAALREEDGD